MPLHTTQFPPAIQHCIQAAARRYAVPADLLRAVWHQENGCGRRVKNRNGSVDYGCMQINSVHLTELRKYGITASVLQHNDCVNFQVGAYYLRASIASAPDFWRGVGAYNSGPYKPSKERVNARYRRQVWDHLVALWQARGGR